MSDIRQVGPYFKEREKVKKLMDDMLKPKSKWTKAVKLNFETAWKKYWIAYDNHDKLHREQKRRKI